MASRATDDPSDPRTPAFKSTPREPQGALHPHARFGAVVLAGAVVLVALFSLVALRFDESRDTSDPGSAAARGPATHAESESAAIEAPAAELPPDAERRRVALRRGETLSSLLREQGVDPSEAHEAIDALRAVISPRGLRAGQEIDLELARGDARVPPGALLQLRFAPTPTREIRVLRTSASDFIAEERDRPLRRVPVIARGTIETSLYAAGGQAEIPALVLVELIRMLSFEVDFQREIRVGDSFSLVYERLVDPRGEFIGAGRILHASIDLSGRLLEFYRFEYEEGRADYFHPDGRSMRKTLMRTPIDGARLSSGFGKRRHPILGYSRMHRGLDFAAPTGTPIYAAGDGVVRFVGWKGGYGRTVMIRHNSTYQTLYGHMSRFARGIKSGRRVEQGEVIGYVGSTGMSTGPHLHYEIHVDGSALNPLDVRLPSGRTLEGEALEAFRRQRAEIDALRERLLADDAPRIARR